MTSTASCTVTQYTGGAFVPRILSVTEETCIVVDSATEVCANCINIHRPSESYLIIVATAHILPPGIYGCNIAACAKRSVRDDSEDSYSLYSHFSRSSHSSPSKSKSLKTVASKSNNKPVLLSKLSSKSPSFESSSNSRSISDSSDSLPNLDSFDLVIYVGVDPQQKMFIDPPLAATTQSTSNRDLVGVVVIGLGVLVLGFALFSYWMKRKDTRIDEQSRLLTQNKYNLYS
jgi:hypothetical protein